MPSIFGHWTKCTFNSRGRGVVCGCLQRPRTLWFIITPRARASDTSRLYDCETVSSCFVARAEDSMARASGNSSRCFERPARSPVAACWLLATTPNIIAPKLHLEWRVQQVPKFGLDFLPPYSPELNPIERVWKLTRRLCLHNRYFAFLDSVVATVETQFAEWTKPNDALRRLCAIT